MPPSRETLCGYILLNNSLLKIIFGHTEQRAQFQSECVYRKISARDSDNLWLGKPFLESTYSLTSNSQLKCCSCDVVTN